MSKAEQKIAQYLNEAHGAEQALERILQSQIAMTPRGRFREGLESHLKQTRDHAKRLRARLTELDQGGSRNPLEQGIGLLQAVLGQALAVGKTPLDLVRGTGGEEKVLKYAKDVCATEALEVATYTAIEQLARSVGDTGTAELATSIRADEQRMLDRVLAEIPKLTEAVVDADVREKPSYDISETGAADAARTAGQSVKESAHEAETSAKRTARGARKVPGVAQLEGQIKGAVASESDLPIAGYGKLTAAEIEERLGGLSQIDLAKVDSYERRNENRTTVLSRITGLRAEEPWPGYDELTVKEIRSAIGEADDDRTKRVRFYERSHKNRAGVLDATDRHAAHA